MFNYLLIYYSLNLWIVIDYIKSAQKHGIVKIGDTAKPEQAWISLCE